jgi:hypothetical protein
MVCAPVAAELDPEEPRRFEEALYWEDYRARNEDEPNPKKPKGKQAKPAPAASPPPQGTIDDGIPFWRRTRTVAIRAHASICSVLLTEGAREWALDTRPSGPSPRGGFSRLLRT